jgi:hypothetical protein
VNRHALAVARGTAVGCGVALLAVVRDPIVVGTAAGLLLAVVVDLVLARRRAALDARFRQLLHGRRTEVGCAGIRHVDEPSMQADLDRTLFAVGWPAECDVRGGPGCQPRTEICASCPGPAPAAAVLDLPVRRRRPRRDVRRG